MGVPALTNTYTRIDLALRSTPDLDRGMQLAVHKTLSASTVSMCFRCPAKHWQQGTSKNTNKLLRQYLELICLRTAKTTPTPSPITHRLNTRPRMCLGFHSPAECVALTR
jgi:IS30 family transposase